MALIDVEGIAWADTAGALDKGRGRKGILDPTIVSTGLPYQGSAAAFTGSNHGLVFPLDGGVSYVCGMLYMPTSVENQGLPFIVNGEGNQEQFTVEIGVGGVLLGRGLSYIASSAGNKSLANQSNIRLNTWNWIEVEFTVNNTTGSIAVYINNTLILSVTGVDTQGSTIAPNCYEIVMQSGTSSVPRIAACYVMDTTGLTNNAAIGAWDVEVIHPDGDGTTNNFTPLSGLTNYEMVDETVSDDDTSYVSSGTVNDSELYTYAALASGFDTVLGVRVGSMLKKEAAGDRLVRQLARSVATTNESAPEGVPIAYSLNSAVFETDPNGGGAWTVSSLNAAEFGMTIES